MKRLNASRPQLLVCGKYLTGDKRLNRLLTKKYDLYIINQVQDLEKIVTQKTINLILIDVLKNRKKKLKTIKQLKRMIPDILIVVVNSSQNVRTAAEILTSGATDVFPMPYDSELLADRVDGLLKNVC